MGRRIKVSEDFYAEDFLEAAERQREARVYARLLALHHVQRGHSYAQVGEKLCVHWRSVQDWVRRYNASGRAGLENQPGQGKKPTLDKSLEAEFKTRWMQQQEAKAGGRLTGKDAQVLLKRWFSVSYSQTSIYRLLHRVGLSWITGRTIHPQANLSVQKDFKKTSSRQYNRPSPAGLS